MKSERHGAAVRGGWIKVKNPAYWRRDQEIEALRRSRLGVSCRCHVRGRCQE